MLCAPPRESAYLIAAVAHEMGVRHVECVCCQAGTYGQAICVNRALPMTSICLSVVAPDAEVSVSNFLRTTDCQVPDKAGIARPEAGPRNRRRQFTLSIFRVCTERMHPACGAREPLSCSLNRRVGRHQQRTWFVALDIQIVHIETAESARDRLDAIFAQHVSSPRRWLPPVSPGTLSFVWTVTSWA
jgi:hypothetical protein